MTYAVIYDMKINFMYSKNVFSPQNVIYWHRIKKEEVLGRMKRDVNPVYIGERDEIR